MSGYLGLVAEDVASLLSQPAPFIIGTLILRGYEVPNHITIGGSQAVTIHKLPGGGRIIDAMGSDDGAVAWHGLFVGPNAAQRARSLDVMRVQGIPQVLSFGDYSFNVIIVHYDYDYQERGTIINYRIRAEIVPNPAESITTSSDVDVALQGDLDAGQTLIMASVAAATTYAPLVGKSDAAKITASAYGLTTVAAGISTTAAAAATSSAVASDKSVQVGLEDVATAVQGNIHILSTPLVASTSLTSITTASSLVLATAQAGFLAALVQTSGYINRARANEVSAGVQTRVSLAHT